MERLEVLAEYGYKRDPFRGAVRETADNLKVKRVIKMAVESRAMVSIVADRGFGKTTAIAMALSETEATVVRLMSSDKEMVRVGDIERALITELSNEEIKRTREIRARQLRRILGESSRQKEIVLVLEEAHRMCGQTLRSLKTLREMEWLGVSPLFTVVMAGQYDPMRKRGVDEVRLRTDTVCLRGLAPSEIREYIKDTAGRHFEDEAVEAAARLKNARNYLELQEITINLMSRALETGQKKVTALDVFEVYGGGLKEVGKRLNISQGEMEKETGIPRSTLNMVYNEKQGTLTDEKFAETRQAVAEVLRKKMEERAGGLKAI